MADNKFTAAQMIKALQETKGMITLAAKRLGCASNTVRRYIREYPTVAEAQREIHEQSGDEVDLVIWDEAIKKRNTAVLIFLAKTKYKERGYVERSEVVNFNVPPELIKQAIEMAEAKGITASDLFNGLIAEFASEEVRAESDSTGDSAE